MLICMYKNAPNARSQEFRAHSEGTEPIYPIAVLVNEGTASASEIVAGALQDHDRALIVGNTTWGKGLVQTVYPLEDGSGLRLTTALYYTPGGRSIQEVGIDPDIVVERETPRDDQVATRRRVREKDLDGHFTQEEADPSSAEEPDVAEKPSVSKDVQLTRAVEVLKSWTYFERFLDRPDVSVQARAAAAD